MPTRSNHLSIACLLQQIWKYRTRKDHDISIGVGKLILVKTEIVYLTTNSTSWPEKLVPCVEMMSYHEIWFGCHRKISIICLFQDSERKNLIFFENYFMSYLFNTFSLSWTLTKRTVCISWKRKESCLIQLHAPISKK